MPGNRLHGATALDSAAIGLHPGNAPAFNDQLLHFSELMDFNAALGGFLGIAPGHGIMARCGAVAVPQTGQNRQVPRVEVKRWHQLTDLLTVDHFGASAEMFVNLCALAEGTYRGIGMCQG